MTLDCNQYRLLNKKKANLLPMLQEILIFQVHRYKSSYDAFFQESLIDRDYIIEKQLPR